MQGKEPAARGPALEILIVDDEPNIRQMMALHLEARGHHVRTVATAAEAMRETAAKSFGVAFVDLRLGADSGLELLSRLLAQVPDLKVVVITAYASVETAVEAMRRGAKDYLPKPFTPAELDLATAKVIDLDRLERRVRTLERGLSQGAPEEPAADARRELESASAAMQTVIALARQVAETDARVLLRGESGTGKGLVAHAIHAWSARRDKPFVTVSCPVLPAELLESELFGHVRGAFTGASRDNPGRVAVAEGGTLLLDEIGDLPARLQPKLLRFIQDREYERVGDPQTRSADVRILAATNRDLEAAVAEGSFREDLLYRLNVITLDIPPLRARPEDVMPLAERFLALFSREYRKPDLRFSAAALSALLAHPWPGNVRELRNAIERATMLATGRDLGPELLLPPRAVRSSPATPGEAATRADSSNRPDGASRPDGAPGAGGGAVALGDLVPLADVEQEHIRRVLARTASLKEAAAVLGVDQATLWRRRKQYGI